MKRYVAPIVLVLAFGWVLRPGDVDAAAGTVRCAQLLDRADALKARGGHLKEALDSYRAAFEVCADQTLPVELDARFAARLGDHLFFYENDPQAAIEVYEEGLEAVTKAGGWEHPGRIPLLDGLARTLDTQAHGEATEQHGWLHLRAIQLTEEALRVRREAYGADSPQVAEGLLKLAALEVEEKPARAERLAREALRLSRANTGAEPASAFEALVMLEDALRREGRDGEADGIQEEIDRLLDEPGPP